MGLHSFSLASRLPCIKSIVLKAAGTPMTMPLPLSSLARLTLLPGEFSTSSTSGRLSPTFTKAREVLWKLREAVHGTERSGTLAVIRRAANILASCGCCDGVWLFSRSRSRFRGAGSEWRRAVLAEARAPERHGVICPQELQGLSTLSEAVR